MTGFYLLDHPPASPQFYPSRANPPTWAVSVHTSEGDTGPGSALNLASFIARRSDPGSYACIVDSSTTVHMVPPLYTTYSVAASGYNSRTWSICLAGRSADLSADDPNTVAMIERAGEAIATLWTLVGVNILEACQWIGTDALNRPGLFCHGDVQPWDRTDAWSIHPQREQLDALLVKTITQSLAPGPNNPTQSGANRMFKLINVDGREEWIALTASGQVVHAWAQTPNGRIGAWSELMPGIQASNLFAEKLQDGRLQVTVTAVGALWESHQISPGAGWTAWANINDGKS